MYALEILVTLFLSSLICFPASSVFDLLADDEPNGKSDGSPAREAHVAFSVEGMVLLIWNLKARLILHLLHFQLNSLKFLVNWILGHIMYDTKQSIFSNSVSRSLWFLL